MTIYGRGGVAGDKVGGTGTAVSWGEDSLQGFAACQQGCGRGAWLRLDLGGMSVAAPAVRVQSVFVVRAAASARRGILRRVFARL